jgi:hypothetical protein
MKRQEFVTLFGGAAVWPHAVRAKQSTMPVVGYLDAASPERSAPLVAAFRRGLSETGYAQGKNVTIEYRWAEGQNNRMPLDVRFANPTSWRGAVGRQPKLLSSTRPGRRFNNG